MVENENKKNQKKNQKKEIAYKLNGKSFRNIHNDNVDTVYITIVRSGTCWGKKERNVSVHYELILNTSKYIKINCENEKRKKEKKIIKFFTCFIVVKIKLKCESCSIFCCGGVVVR